MSSFVPRMWIHSFSKIIPSVGPIRSATNVNTHEKELHLE